MNAALETVRAGAPLGTDTDFDSVCKNPLLPVDLQPVTEADIEAEGTGFNLPEVWTGPDLFASDGLWRLYAARIHARQLLCAYGVRHRMTFCGARVRLRKEGVGVYRRPDRVVGRVSGICLCGGSITCPVCAPRISARRVGELVEAVNVCRARGYAVQMATYTLKHAAGCVLFDEVDVWKRAWRVANTGWCSGRARANRVGYVNSAEVTFGQFSWNFHRHLLLIGREPANALALKDAWRKGAMEVGRYDRNFEEHGFNLLDVELGAERYIAKIGREIGSPHGKTSSRTPLRLLIDDMLGDRLAGEAWIESVVALSRHKVGAVRWSPRLRGYLGLDEEKTDEQLAAEEAVPTDELLGYLSEHQWQRVVEKKIEFQVVAAAQDGVVEVNKLLAAHSIAQLHAPERWIPAPAVQETQGVLSEQELNREYSDTDSESA